MQENVIEKYHAHAEFNWISGDGPVLSLALETRVFFSFHPHEGAFNPRSGDNHAVASCSQSAACCSKCMPYQSHLPTEGRPSRHTWLSCSHKLKFTQSALLSYVVPTEQYASPGDVYIYEAGAGNPPGARSAQFNLGNLG